MSEKIEFKLIEGDMDNFYPNFVSELQKNNITAFTMEKEIFQSRNYAYKPFTVNYIIKLDTNNLDKMQISKSLKILEKNLKKLTEFEFLIKALGKSCLINEKDNIRKIINETFADFAIYNPETGSYFIIEAKANIRIFSEAKSNKLPKKSLKNLNKKVSKKEYKDPVEFLLANIGTVEAPEDWSSEHDHYIYGTPKKNAPKPDIS